MQESEVEEQAGTIKFEVEWISQCNLPFSEMRMLSNSLNENKPVTISRDGQELPADVGERVCEMFNELGFTENRSKRAKRSES